MSKARLYEPDVTITDETTPLQDREQPEHDLRELQLGPLMILCGLVYTLGTGVLHWYTQTLLSQVMFAIAATGLVLGVCITVAITAAAHLYELSEGQ